MSNPDEIRDDIERTRAEFGQDVDALADKVSPSKMAERQTRRMRNAVTSLKDRVMGAASSATDSAQDMIGGAGDAVADSPHKLASTTRGNPIAVGLIAFGVGWLAASLVPASKVERDAAEHAKDAAAPLVGQVKDIAAETADHLREPAKDAADAVKDRAAEAVDTVREEGESAAADVKNEAKHTAQQHASSGDAPSGASPSGASPSKLP
ncbi:DUF3618 domain-containing protein [Agromyces badenianii]|uniref:DUF3618 domain-containing protein n=1 Tax=Agromyces badenianii TaxID=2080742 RepID=UPI000D58FCAD|nr:DUF3618 domain-containing protein [Agromyces badenianii]PWC03245.1 hypothetical protein DCE94_13430 [Agromyces badenianii]